MITPAETQHSEREERALGDRRQERRLIQRQQSAVDSTVLRSIFAGVFF